MTKFKISLLFLLLPAAIFLTSCGGNQESADKQSGDSLAQEQNVEQSEYDILVNYLEANGNYLNTTPDKGGAPSMIKAKDLKNMMGDDIYVIDIRDGKTFSEGHIKGAVNIQDSYLLYHLNNEIDASKYKKIVIACYTGQTASFNASLLQLSGFNNVVALKWGMNSWNSKLNKKWLANIGNRDDITETTANPKAAPGNYPEINTGMEDAEAILDARINEVFANGIGNAKVKLEDLADNLDNYYIVNYWPEELYNTAHLKGAMQYTPRKSLHTTADLATLPTDKPIIIYCFTGQHSAAVVSYLRILGYDAYTLLYGSNGFMNKYLVDTDHHGYSDKISNNFELETSEYVEPEGGASYGGC